MTNYLLLAFCCLSLVCGLLVIISKNPIHSILYLILVFCNVTFVMIILNVEFIAITFLIVYVGAIAVLFLFVVMMLNIKILELDEVFWKYIPVGLIISSVFLLQIFYYVFSFDITELFGLFFKDDLYYLKKLDFFYTFPNFNNFSQAIMSHYAERAGFHGVEVTPSLISMYKYTGFIVMSKVDYWGMPANFTFELTNTEMLGWLVYTYTFFVFLVIGLILLVAMVGSIVLVLNQNINIKRQLIFRQTLRDLNSSVVLKK